MACSISDIDMEADIKIISANIYYNNPKTAWEITSSLLEQDGDVYLLHEAEIGVNVDEQLFIQNGYTLFSQEESQLESYRGVLASRIPALYETLPFSYSFRDFAKDRDFTVFPFYAMHIEKDGYPISIIGAHIPHVFRTSFEVDELRTNAYNDISSIIGDGKIIKSTAALSVGDNVILGGDLNTFPTDPLLDNLLNSGLDNSFLSNPDKYDYTWSPWGVSNISRIDYIFHSKNLVSQYQDCFDIDGSDHMGIIAGINLNEM